MRDYYINSILEFMYACGQLDSGEDGRSFLNLRFALIFEEIQELKEEINNYIFDTTARPKLEKKVKLYDELVDVYYVVLGTYISLGVEPDLDTEDVFSEISNTTTLLNLWKDSMLCLLHNQEVEHKPLTYLDSLLMKLENMKAELSIDDEILDLFFNEKHRSNMTKVREDGSVLKNDKGKVIKPETYEPPNYIPIIEQYSN